MWGWYFDHLSNEGREIASKGRRSLRWGQSNIWETPTSSPACVGWLWAATAFAFTLQLLSGNRSYIYRVLQNKVRETNNNPTTQQQINAKHSSSTPERRGPYSLYPCGPSLSIYLVLGVIFFTNKISNLSYRLSGSYMFTHFSLGHWHSASPTPRLHIQRTLIS